MKQVVITLEFEDNNVTHQDIKQYLKELIEDDNLDYEVVIPTATGGWA